MLSMIKQIKIKKNKHLNDLASHLLVIGDPSRLKILCVIFNTKKACVSEIAKRLNMSVAIVSHHLRTLAGENIVIPKREGKKVCYLVANKPLIKDLKNLICKYN